MANGEGKGYVEWNPRSRTRERLAQVQAILDEYDDYKPLTVRQVFYRMVGRFGYDKTEKAYANLGYTLRRARRARVIEFSDLRDDGISVLENVGFRSIADFLDEQRRQAQRFRRDRQQGQAYNVELWCEAAGMMPQLDRVAERYGISVRSNGGYTSLSGVRQIVDGVISRDKPTVLLHVGDFDYDGEGIYEAMTTDAIEFLREDNFLPGLRSLIPVRIALTREQVDRYDLPTDPSKPGRSAGFGGTCQAEALPPNVLADEVRAAIERFIDGQVLEDTIEAEKFDRVELLRMLTPGTDDGQGEP